MMNCKKKNLSHALVACLLATLLSACDEGRLYEDRLVLPEEGLVLKLTGRVSGIDTWPGDYSVVVAGFSGDNEYASITKNVPLPATDGAEVEVVVAGISEDITRLELCAVDRLRHHMATFVALPSPSEHMGEDTVRCDVGTVDVGMYRTVQTQVFDASCTSCHGATGTASASLFLTGDRSYEALVGQPSRLEPERLLVSPGNADESFLSLVLHENGHTGMNHVDILSGEPDMLTLMDDWIDHGAQP